MMPTSTAFRASPAMRRRELLMLPPDGMKTMSAIWYYQVAVEPKKPSRMSVLLSFNRLCSAPNGAEFNSPGRLALGEEVERKRFKALKGRQWIGGVSFALSGLDNIFLGHSPQG